MCLCGHYAVRHDAMSLTVCILITTSYAVFTHSNLIACIMVHACIITFTKRFLRASSQNTGLLSIQPLLIQISLMASTTNFFPSSGEISLRQNLSRSTCGSMRQCIKRAFFHNQQTSPESGDCLRKGSGTGAHDYICIDA